MNTSPEPALEPPSDSHWDVITDPPRYYDRDGKPLSLRQWSDLYEDPEQRFVAETWVGKYRVSTVWLGLDHNHFWALGGQPHIFETMVFDRSAPGLDSYHDLEMRRYSTEAQARAGHEDMVQLVKTWNEKPRT